MLALLQHRVPRGQRGPCEEQPLIFGYDAPLCRPER